MMRRLSGIGFESPLPKPFPCHRGDQDWRATTEKAPAGGPNSALEQTLINLITPDESPIRLRRWDAQRLGVASAAFMTCRRIH